MNSAMATVLNDVNLDLQIGPVFIGIILNWFFLGILIVQLYKYFAQGYEDLPILRLTVITLIILNVTQTILTTHASWKLLVQRWGDPSAVNTPSWSLLTVPLMSGLTAMVVQLFFAWRIMHLKNTWPTRCVALTVALIALLQALGAALGTAHALNNHKLSPTKLLMYFKIWLAGSLVDDVLIAITMCAILANAAQNTASRNIGPHLERIMRFTIQTGAITAVVALLELFLFIHFPKNNLHFIPAMLLGKLYSNVMFASLNLRRSSYTTGSLSCHSNGVPLSDIRDRIQRPGTLSITVPATTATIVSEATAEDAEKCGIKAAGGGDVESLY